MSADVGGDDPQKGSQVCDCCERERHEARVWKEVAEALFAACSFDEFGALHDVHAGDMRQAAELFRHAQSSKYPSP